MELWTAFVIGLTGSLHCVGMCGPIALALPLSRSDRWKALFESLLYNAGRVAMYVALGALFGLLGKGFAVAGLQVWLSAAAGLLLIVFSLTFFSIERQLLSLPGVRRLAGGLRTRLGRLLAAHRQGSHFAIGLFNGLLPCGMVYAALAGAITTCAGMRGSAYMALFGLGTIPLMLGVSLSGHLLSAGFRRRLRLVQPVLLLLMGLFFLYRAFHLDLSLFDAAVPRAVPECH